MLRLAFVAKQQEQFTFTVKHFHSPLYSRSIKTCELCLSLLYQCLIQFLSFYCFSTVFLVSPPPAEMLTAVADSSNYQLGLQHPLRTL